MAALAATMAVLQSASALPQNTPGQGFVVTPSDLDYILTQIKIAEAHVANTSSLTGPCGALLRQPGDGFADAYQLSSPQLEYGLRTVDGTCNNLVSGQESFGAASQVFPRLTTPEFRPAENRVAPFGPPTSTSYAQTAGLVFDSEPRTVSNLIVDQTSTNPAAVAAAAYPVRTQGNEGYFVCGDPNIPVNAENLCVPAGETLPIPNVTTDVGLSPPFNGLFALFGQFFDHGLDKITNGGNGTVVVPLKTDDPLYITPTVTNPFPPNFMMVTRGTIFPGPDGFRTTLNTDTPFVDQSQTYTSNPSHQVFTREYVNNVNGLPVSTGKLLASPDGGLPNWAEVKLQAATLLGLELVDSDVTNIPMLKVDAYGNFIPGLVRGLPQYFMSNGTFVEGFKDDPMTPLVNEAISVAEAEASIGVPAFRIGIAFLNDIAHAAAPTAGGPDADAVAGGSLDIPAPAGSYDDELLDLHFIAGDGRANENIGLTAIHQIFHSEHDRLVGDIKNVLLTDTSGITSLTDWQTVLGADGWNGERLFQAARFVTEMEYQHLVFEEFARKIQPAIDPFNLFAFGQTNINPAISAEFADAVYRFGHSMLTETIDRTNLDGSTNNVDLFTAFLNPAEYHNGGPAGPLTSQAAAGSIFQGMQDQVGNEIDEFVTDVLRNRLVGLPLDLPAINMARARSEGVPRLNDLRKQLFITTNDAQLAPYTSWLDFGLNIKHPESLVNFIAAYADPAVIEDLVESPLNSGVEITPGGVPTTVEGLRANAAELLAIAEFGGNDPADYLAGEHFLNSTGLFADVAGISVTGVDDIDLWVGGLAERTNLFGGHLGSTFNYVFEEQMTRLQNGDRFYYIARTLGMNLLTQLEGNSFSELVMRNTTTTTMKADPFAVADCRFELGNLVSPATSGFYTGVTSIQDDPASPCDENLLLLRMSNGTIRYRTSNQVDPAGINGQSVFNGTNANDRMWGGIDNDTFWGGLGNDIIEGNDGADVVLGGEGNDIITDSHGDDVLKGGPGNDAIDSGPGLDIVLGGSGHDLLNTGFNGGEVFAGPGNDFSYGSAGADVTFAGGGDDWIEGLGAQDLLIGDSSSFFFIDQDMPGSDVFFGDGGDDDYDAEGGDDVMVAGPGIEKASGEAGYDWLIGLYDAAQDVDLNLKLAGVPVTVNDLRTRFDEVEALSGWMHNDILRGADLAPRDVTGVGFVGCNALDQDSLNQVTGFDALIPDLTEDPAAIIASSQSRHCRITLDGPVFADGDVLIGGAGSDLIEGRGANDIIDGDLYMNVRLSVRTNPADPLTEIGSTDRINSQALTGSFGPGTAGMNLQQAVFAGLVDPGNVAIVRELIDGTPDPLTDLSVDVALFTGPSSDFIIELLADNLTFQVTHAPAVPVGIGQGIDLITNVEILRFVTIDPVTGAVLNVEDIPTGLGAANSPATGTVNLDSLAPVEGTPITATANNIVDFDGFALSGVTLTWQAEVAPATWAGVGSGATFTPGDAEVGLVLRVVANFTDFGLTPEQLMSAVTAPVVNVNDAPTGAAVISDLTPTETVPLSVDVSTIADADGLGVLAIQWQRNAADIPGANLASYTPVQADVNATLRVVVTYTDGHGTPETVISAATGGTGDFIPANGAGQTLTGTAFDDIIDGGGGDDTINSLAGSDIVNAGVGTDTVNTGAGNDIINVNGVEGFDNVNGGADVDTMRAMSIGTSFGLSAIAGVESIDAFGSANVRITGHGGATTLNFSAVSLIGIVEIDGNAGADNITGSVANDQIRGSAGNDNIFLAAGGNDTMKFAAGYGADDIRNFDSSGGAGQDLLDISTLGVTALNFNASVTIANGGGGSTRIRVGGGTIRLWTTAPANITAADFIL